MSKTILANVDGFTPVIDSMIPEVGAMTALVFGKAWRYCQMADGVCKAAQERIADELGVSRQTINAHFSKLCEAGYLKDLTPELAGLPHRYADTGKANLSINLTATCQKSLQPPVKNFDTKKEVKRESIINDNEQKSENRNAMKDFSNNIQLLTPMSADKINDLVAEYTDAWVCDAIKIAVDNNARNLRYIEAVLKGWKANGKGWKPGQDKAAKTYQPKQPERRGPAIRSLD